jgi:hypothetical protein
LCYDREGRYQQHAGEPPDHKIAQLLSLAPNEAQQAVAVEPDLVFWVHNYTKYDESRHYFRVW